MASRRETSRPGRWSTTWSLTLCRGTPTAKPYVSSTTYHQAFRYFPVLSLSAPHRPSRSRSVSWRGPPPLLSSSLLTGTRASEPREALHCQRLSQTLLPPRQRERTQGEHGSLVPPSKIRPLNITVLQYVIRAFYWGAHYAVSVMSVFYFCVTPLGDMSQTLCCYQGNFRAFDTHTDDKKTSGWSDNNGICTGSNIPRGFCMFYWRQARALSVNRAAMLFKVRRSLAVMKSCCDVVRPP